MIKEKWAIIQPVVRNGGRAPRDMTWSQHSFLNMSYFLDAPLYHVEDEIPLIYDAYWLTSFDINLLEKEIAFVKKVKEKGAKVFVCFSHDLRFLHGAGLMNARGILYTALCEVADVIGSGVGEDMCVYGRYQNKVMSMGEILFDMNLSKPYEQRTIDLLISGSGGEEALSFGLEFLLTVKEKYPEKRIVCPVQLHHTALILRLQENYPQIEFPLEGALPLIEYMKNAKVYCNPELRPRPGRALMEAYYCRVPFISSSMTYFSRICPNYTYSKNDILDMVEKYEQIINSNIETLMQNMEIKAKHDFFDNFYKRLSQKMNF